MSLFSDVSGIIQVLFYQEQVEIFTLRFIVFLAFMIPILFCQLYALYSKIQGDRHAAG